MKLIKGFRDIFPDAENDINNSALWNYIIESIKQSLYKFNFSEILFISIGFVESINNILFSFEICEIPFV